LKDESIKYCNQDCINLYQVIENFNILIFNKYSLNIHKFPTLSDNFIGTELGLMKLYYNFIEATFIAHKVYGGVYSDNNNQLKSITKVKGYKNKLDYNFYYIYLMLNLIILL